MSLAYFLIGLFISFLLICESSLSIKEISLLSHKVQILFFFFLHFLVCPLTLFLAFLCLFSRKADMRPISTSWL